MSFLGVTSFLASFLLSFFARTRRGDVVSLSFVQLAGFGEVGSPLPLVVRGIRRGRFTAPPGGSRDWAGSFLASFLASFLVSFFFGKMVFFRNQRLRGSGRRSRGFGSVVRSSVWCSSGFPKVVWLSFWLSFWLRFVVRRSFWSAKGGYDVLSAELFQEERRVSGVVAVAWSASGRLFFGSTAGGKG